MSTLGIVRAIAAILCFVFAFLSQFHLTERGRLEQQSRILPFGLFAGRSNYEPMGWRYKLLSVGMFGLVVLTMVLSLCQADF